MLLLAGTLSCISEPPHDQQIQPKITEHPMKTTRVLKDTVVVLSNGEKLIPTSVLHTKKKKLRGTILALPGWSYPYSHWCDSTELCDLALDYGYNLIMPTIGKSIYTKKIYTQTRSDWKKEVTTDWFDQVFIPYMQDSMGLLTQEESNYILGISTGARGALILAEEQPGLFKAIALMSGDYDQHQFPNDNLYKGYFGSIEQYPELYSGDENPMTDLGELKCSVLIIHGLNDKIVNPAHSEYLFDKLDLGDEHEKILRTNSAAGHNYSFWSEEMTKVIDFFNTTD